MSTTNGKIMTGGDYFLRTIEPSSQIVQSKLSSVPRMVRMSQVEEYPKSLKRRKLTAMEWSVLLSSYMFRVFGFLKTDKMHLTAKLFFEPIVLHK